MSWSDAARAAAAETRRRRAADLKGFNKGFVWHGVANHITGKSSYRTRKQIAVHLRAARGLARGTPAAAGSAEARLQQRFGPASSKLAAKIQIRNMTAGRTRAYSMFDQNTFPLPTKRK